MAGKIEDASAILTEMPDDPDLNSYRTRIKDIEHECDQLTHQITNKLNKSIPMAGLIAGLTYGVILIIEKLTGTI